MAWSDIKQVDLIVASMFYTNLGYYERLEAHQVVFDAKIDRIILLLEEISGKLGGTQHDSK